MGDTGLLDQLRDDRRRPAKTEAASVAFGGADDDINTIESEELALIEESIAPGIQYLSDADNLRSHASGSHVLLLTTETRGDPVRYQPR